MKEIVLHIGLRRVGASLIEDWLGERGYDLEQHHSTAVVAIAEDLADVPDDEFPPLTTYDRGILNLGRMGRRYSQAGGAQKELYANRFAEGLRRAGEQAERVVATCHTFDGILMGQDSILSKAINGLADTHNVTLAIYARPQHEAALSEWATVGFRSKLKPSVFMGRMADRLDYESIVRAVTSAHPNCKVAIRLATEQTLEDGSIVADFATQFLNPKTLRSDDSDRRQPPDLPLPLATALRNAPRGMFWKGTADNRQVDQIRRLYARTDLQNPPDMEWAKLTVRQWCHNMFEAGNQRLIAEFGWDIEHIVPPVAELADRPELTLDIIDDALTPRSSPTEQTILYRALQQAIRR